MATRITKPREAVEVHKRKRLSQKHRAARLDLFGNACPGCDLSFVGVPIEWDHIIPLALGGTNKPENWQPLCLPCHLDKTKADVTAIAKANRLSGKTGQAARRERRDRPLLQSRPNAWPKGRSFPPRKFSKWKPS